MVKATEKVALVTGGGQGIGKGIVRRLLEEGLRVVIAEVDRAAGVETAEEYGRLGTVRFYRCGGGALWPGNGAAYGGMTRKMSYAG